MYVLTECVSSASGIFASIAVRASCSMRAPVRLPPQPAKLHLLLASSPRELVSRDEIQKSLWGDDTFGALAFSPDGRWLASAGEDRTIRLWRVPDVTQTPPHKRSHEEFLAILLSWTNLRAVRDANSATRWRLEPKPFPGWAKSPDSG